MATYITDQAGFLKFLRAIKAGPLYATVESNGGLEYARIEDAISARLNLEMPRPAGSLRPFFFPSKERVAVYPSGETAWQPELDAESPQILVGLRACDIKALQALDQVFLAGDFREPFYEVRRKSTIMISADCSEAAPSCFCNVLGFEPYPVEGYDLNVSCRGKDLLVEPGSERGERLVLSNKSLFAQASPDALAGREETRKRTRKALEDQNTSYAFDGKMYEICTAGLRGAPAAWKEFANMCVECGGCTHICPTCHCYYLYDQTSNHPAGPYERVRAWDSCLYSGYSQMAAVGMSPSPRPELKNRLQRRVGHKYVYFVENHQMLGCVGCGRCFDACPGRIDLREVLRKIRS